MQQSSEQHTQGNPGVSGLVPANDKTAYFGSTLRARLGNVCYHSVQPPSMVTTEPVM